MEGVFFEGIKFCY